MLPACAAWFCVCVCNGNNVNKSRIVDGNFSYFQFICLSSSDESVRYSFISFIDRPINMNAHMLARDNGSTSIYSYYYTYTYRVCTAALQKKKKTICFNKPTFSHRRTSLPPSAASNIRIHLFVCIQNRLPENK